MVFVIDSAKIDKHFSASHSDINKAVVPTEYVDTAWSYSTDGKSTTNISLPCNYKYSGIWVDIEPLPSALNPFNTNTAKPHQANHDSWERDYAVTISWSQETSSYNDLFVTTGLDQDRRRCIELDMDMLGLLEEGHNRFNLGKLFSEDAFGNKQWIPVGMRGWSIGVNSAHPVMFRLRYMRKPLDKSALGPCLDSRAMRGFAFQEFDVMKGSTGLEKRIQAFDGRIRAIFIMCEKGIDDAEQFLVDTVLKSGYGYACEVQASSAILPCNDPYFAHRDFGNKTIYVITFDTGDLWKKNVEGGDSGVSQVSVRISKRKNRADDDKILFPKWKAWALIDNILVVSHDMKEQYVQYNLYGK